MLKISLKEIVVILVVCLLISHFIISLGQIERFFDLLTETYYWIDLMYVMLITSVVIFSLYLTHRYLDSRWPLQGRLKQRLIYQTILVILLPSIIVLIFSALYQSVILGYEFTATSFLQYEFPVAILIIVICNLVLIVVSMFKSRPQVPATAAQAPAKKDVLLVQQGNRNIPVDTSDIAAIYKEGEWPVIFTFSGKQFVLSETLDYAMSCLDEGMFFRANRQAIVHVKICEHYTTHRSGKIELKLANPLDRHITVSQKRAKEFKSWITKP